MRTEDIPVLKKIYNNCINEGHTFEDIGEFEWAAESYKEAKALADLIRMDGEFLHPMIVDCYRNAHNPKSAISYFDSLKMVYDPSFIFNVGLLTSVAAAYCDDDQWEMAEQTLHKAKDANKGEFNYEMYLIEDRIKQYYYENKPNFYR